MPTTVLISLAVILLFVLIAIFMLMRGTQMRKKRMKEVFADAIPAQATVLGLARGGFESGTKLELKLTLHVQHPTRVPYEASMKWVVDDIAVPRVQPQQVVPVRINRDHPERVYPDAEWAEFWDWTLKDLAVKKAVKPKLR